jgi:CRP-like cAMP-binding protein
MGQNPFQNFIVRFKRGEAVFREGDRGSTMFIVQSGEIGLFRQTNGNRQTLGLLEKGDFFGEMSILEGRERPHCAIAEQDAELIEINNTIFDKMIRGNIEIAVRMLRKLSLRLREAETKITDLKTGNQLPTRRAGGGPSMSKTSVDYDGVRLQAKGQDFAYPVRESETLIGRFDPVTQLKPDIDLTDLDLKRSVSRQHARILKTDGGYAVIEEVGALNGTFVNEKQLTTGQSHPITEGDEIVFGSVSVVFRAS